MASVHRLLAPVVQVREEESRTLLLMFLYSFLAMTAYNILKPLAAGVLYKAGILLSPAAGAVLMSVSTIIVAINASMLKVK